MFEIGSKSGEEPWQGQSFLVKHPQTEHKYTIQRQLHKFINIKIFKKMMEWGFEEEQIWEALK